MEHCNEPRCILFEEWQNLRGRFYDCDKRCKKSGDIGCQGERPILPGTEIDHCRFFAE